MLFCIGTNFLPKGTEVQLLSIFRKAFRFPIFVPPLCAFMPSTFFEKLKVYEIRLHRVPIEMGFFVVLAASEACSLVGLAGDTQRSPIPPQLGILFCWWPLSTIIIIIIKHIFLTYIISTTY